jgi:hypothetical protein
MSWKESFTAWKRLLRENAPHEWLEMSHMSVLGAFWVDSFLEKEVYFGCRPIFWEGSILRKNLNIRKEDLMLEHKQ